MSTKTSPKSVLSLGRRLASLRAERRLTLREVAQGCGLAESFLSKLERDKVNISVGNLGKIAQFYNVPIGHFFDTSNTSAQGVVVKMNEYSRLTRTNPNVAMSMLLPHQHSIDAVLVETPVGQSESAHHGPCSGDEFTYIIKGRLRYWVGDEEYTLDEGSTIYHASDLPHRWENIGSEPAISITACVPGVSKSGSHAKVQYNDSSFQVNPSNN